MFSSSYFITFSGITFSGELILKGTYSGEEEVEMFMIDVSSMLSDFCQLIN